MVPADALHVKVHGKHILLAPPETVEATTDAFATPYILERLDQKFHAPVMQSIARRKVLAVGSKCDRQNVVGWIALVDLGKQDIAQALDDKSEIWHEGHIMAYFNKVIIEIEESAV